MTVIVESKKMKVTKSLRLFAEKQAEKLKKLEKEVSQVRIHLENVAQKKSDAHANSVVYRISVPGKDIVVKKHAVDMYSAIVSATQGAVRKLRKATEKKISTQRHARL